MFNGSKIFINGVLCGILRVSRNFTFTVKFYLANNLIQSLIHEVQKIYNINV